MRALGNLQITLALGGCGVKGSLED
ncbi:MAG: lipoprotein [Planctomycetota bacterium]